MSNLTVVLVTFTAALWVTYGPWAAVVGSLVGFFLIAVAQATWATARLMRAAQQNEGTHPVAERRG